MFTRTNLIFLGILVLAIGATIATAVRTRDPHDPSPEINGKLSKDTIEVETAFKAFQEKWKQGEPAFRAGDTKSFEPLGRLQTEVKDLLGKAKKLKGLTAPECDAIVHLTASIEASGKVLDPYLLNIVNKAIVSQKNWDEAKAHAITANKEWAAWQEATKSMSR
jgi:hypothetical protein